MLATLVLPLLLMQAPSPTADAIVAAKQALDAVLASDRRESRAAADAWRAMARAHGAARQRAETVAAHQQQLVLRERFTTQSTDLIELAACRMELAGALRAHDRFDEALTVLADVPPELAKLEGAKLDPKQWALLRVGYLTGYAQVKMLQGDQAQARPMLEQALVIATEGLGENAPNTQAVRQSLATVFALTGEPEKARELAERALVSSEASNGPDHLKTAHAAFVLGQFQRLCGRNDEAVRSLERAVAVRKKKLGPRHADTLAAMFASVQMLCATSQYESARAPLTELLTATREVLGADHHQTVEVEEMLAEVLAEQQVAAEALPLARHALQMRLAARGERLGPVVSARLTLARVLHALGEHDEAVAECEHALADDDGSDRDTTRHIHQRLANFLPAVGREQDAIEHARTNLSGFEAFLAARLPVMLDRERVDFVRARRYDLDHILSWSSSASEVAAAHRDGIAWKAQVARGLFAQRSWLRRNLDAATATTLEELQTVLTSLAAAQQRGDAAAREVLQQQRTQLEASLPARGEQSASVAPAAIYARLGPGEALVDFYVYERAERATAVGPHLLAFVVAGGKASVRVDFGPLDAIRNAVQSHLQVTSRCIKAADAASRAATAAIGARIRSLLWLPLGKAIGDCTRVFVCPDGPIALLPFAVIPGAAPGSFLVEHFEFVSLVSPTDLLRPAAGSPPTRKAVVVGDVEYGAEATNSRTALATRSEGGVNKHFRPLPHTGAEVGAVGGILTAAGHEVVTLRGDRATHAALAAAAKGAHLLHLATHGEFGTAGDAAALPGQRGGIALAGADAGGVVTTDEIAWLDLADCELAVLSACDTATGEATAGEHVLGLRRALRLAGARCTITSAWSIDDVATANLMVDFYRRLASGVAAATALRDAQLALLAQNRAAGDPMPGTWGAFLFEGG